MELRQYVQILRRRWWMPISLALLVGLLSAVQLKPWQPQPVSYTVSMRLLLGVMPATEADGTTYDPRYTAAQTSEYLVDDFTEVVHSELFARNVSRRLAGQGLQIPAGLLQGSASTGKTHRIVSIRFGWPDRGEAVMIAEAALAELSENALTYFRQLGMDGAVATLIDGPTVSEVGPALRQRIELPLRIALGFLVGLGLIFLLDYLDVSIRNQQELEELGFAVLGAIPKHR